MATITFSANNKTVFTVPLEGSDNVGGLRVKREVQAADNSAALTLTSMDFNPTSSGLSAFAERIYGPTYIASTSLTANLYSLKVDAPAGTVNASTNKYGIYVDAPTGAGNNYAIYTPGVIGGATWNGALISGKYGGTGVDNTGKTITLGGNISTFSTLTTTVGAISFAAAAGGSTLTLPASGTLATTADITAATQGLDVKASVKVVTTAELTSVTQDGTTITANVNGAITGLDAFDGQHAGLGAGDRILVKNQGATTGANAKYNGIYTITTVGSAVAAWVLTRATDFNSDAKVTANAFTFAETGTTYADTGWVLVSDGPLTLNTSNLTFTQFSGTGSSGISGDGNNITFSSNTVSLSSTPNFTNVQYKNGAYKATVAAHTSLGTDISIVLPLTAGTLARTADTFYIGSTSVALNQGSGTVTSLSVNITGNAATATSATSATTATSAGTATTATTATNIASGALGSVPYQSGSGATALLSPNTAATQKFLAQTGTGTVGAAPVWTSLAIGDLPSSIPVSLLAASSVAIGSTNITLGAAATTTISGLSTVYATTFTGALSGNASTATSATSADKATNLVGAGTNANLGALPYQSNTDVTSFLAPNTSTTKKFLQQSGDNSNGAAPVWTTLSASDLPTVPISLLSASTYAIGTTTASLGTTTLGTISGLTAVYATTFTGALSGNASTATSATSATTATNIASGALGSVPYQSGSGATGFVAGNSTLAAKFFKSQGDGTNITAPTFASLAAADLPSVNIGTTSVPLSRASGALNLAGIGQIGYYSATPNKTATLTASTSMSADIDIVLPTTSGTLARTADALYIGTTSVALNTTSGTITSLAVDISGKATNIAGGAIGQVPYQSAAGTTVFASGNTTTANWFLRSTGTGSAATAPIFTTLSAAGDVVGLSVASGKTLTVSNTLTFSGTDSTSFTLPSASATLLSNLTGISLQVGSNSSTKTGAYHGVFNYLVWGSTTGTGSTRLTSTAGATVTTSTVPVMPAGVKTTWMTKMYITAYNTLTDKGAAWEITSSFRKDASDNAVMLGEPMVIASADSSATGLLVNVDVDTTTAGSGASETIKGALNITVTGIGSNDNVNWSALIQTIEVGSA